MTIDTEGMLSRLKQLTEQELSVGRPDRRDRTIGSEEQVAIVEVQEDELLETGVSSRDKRASGLAIADQVVNEERGNPQLTALHQIGLHLRKRRSPGALAQEVVRIVASMPGYERTAILLVDRVAKQLKPFALSEIAYGDDFSRAQDQYLSSHDLRLGVGIAGSVAHLGRPICLGNIPDDERFNSAHLKIRSAVCVPIRIEDAVIGVIFIESDKPQTFVLADQQFLEIVSGQIAIAIQNAHLYSRVGRKAKQEAAEVSGSALQTAEPERKLDESLEDSEARFRAMVKELQAQNEELNAFNHTVAHDLKNPLSILLGFAEVLSQDYGGGADEVLDQGIRVILENGHRMESIISELLLLAEVRQLDEITVEPLDMASIVVETRNRLSHHIAEYEAKIIVPAAWPSAVGHRPWVEEIWVNYLSNAIKYGGTPPKVELGAMAQSDGMVRFWVRDNGVGITKNDQKRLFVPFTKLKQVNTKGHGLGLSIVQRITIKLGGTVGVESEPGMGSLFWFTLPMAQ